MRFPTRTAASCYQYAFVITALVLALTWPATARAQTMTSVLTYPKNLATNVDLLQPMQWTSVANAQAYYVYVGSTPGAKDLLNSGSTLQTSWLALSLPPGQTLYVRLWTRVADSWRFVDSTFVAAPVLKAWITYPVNGAVGADLTRPIQWTPVANVQAYYLYVGTSVGAKDLVNTGETQKTSYPAVTLPVGQTLYARLWTKAADVWRYADSSFTTAAAPPPIATLAYPANGAVNIDQTPPATWAAVAGAQAYYLKIGSTVGAKDIIDSFETPLTAFPILGIPAGRT